MYINAAIIDPLNDDYATQFALASNEHTSSRDLSNLINSNYADVQEALAANPNTPESVLDALSDVEDYGVQKALHIRGVHSNESLSIEFIIELLPIDEEVCYEIIEDTAHSLVNTYGFKYIGGQFHTDPDNSDFEIFSFICGIPDTYNDETTLDAFLEDLKLALRGADEYFTLYSVDYSWLTE